VHEPVRLRDEGLDLAFALDHQRQRRGLHAAERDDAADPGAAANRGGAGGVHADEPVGLGAGARRRLERAQLLAGPELLEAFPDRLLGHRADPEALDGLVDAGGLVDVREDQLAFAAGVAGVHDPGHVVALQQLVDHLQLLLGLLVTRVEPELLREDRQVGHAPLLEALVVLLRVDQLHEVADRERDHGVVRLEIGVVILEGSGESIGQVPGDRRLLCDHKSLHAIHLSERPNRHRKG
jgi:hypothetical protein